MSIETDLLAAIDVLKTYNSASLSYISGSTTVSASVFSSYGEEVSYITEDGGYQMVHTDKSVVAKNSDIEGWNLIPKKTKVTLNDTDYLIGGVKTTCPSYTWIYLRFYDNTL